jgi:nicotinate-nucleotide pyrophosphorylase (carboxylating)
MLKSLIADWLKEDIGEGDYTSQAIFTERTNASAQLLVKGEGLIAGVQVAKEIITFVDPKAKFNIRYDDGTWVKYGDVAFSVESDAKSLLSCERLLLNCMQRMSGIATKTRVLQTKISHTSAKLLDTRKTTPGFRILEKQAVIIGGGLNHRFGLFDMIMLKDNHIDFAGGITKAVDKVTVFKRNNNLTQKVEVEVRNLKELDEVISIVGVDRIMLDNFTPEEIRNALTLIPKGFEVEASGGINESNIVEYAETGVDFISVGALTHNVQSLDLSFKALIHP